jgi:hypothetical protein
MWESSRLAAICAQWRIWRKGLSHMRPGEQGGRLEMVDDEDDEMLVMD